MALDLKEISDPLIKELLRVLKLLWAKVVDAITEKYPTPQDSSEIDTTSWKTIFEDIVDSPMKNDKRNSDDDDDPTPTLDNLTRTASESIGDLVHDSCQRIASPTIPKPAM
ncbi:uncharacterized protein DFL_001406 [Arthrobotrys flagrans]|uniref:Uncharacterized protein n=1 Tax=Arthrobotrys flagrans TaxID=97331 RepID=A0A437AH35_ARTFL|nr:hypothetical protein DFL_001406 [Arthrobotrys flagrans]